MFKKMLYVRISPEANEDEHEKVDEVKVKKKKWIKIKSKRQTKKELMRMLIIKNKENRRKYRKEKQ